MTNVIPEHILNDKYWRPVIFLFVEHDKLNQYFTHDYFDFEERAISIQKLRNKTKVWSESEKFMLNLAFHLFNERNKISLGDMDYLDCDNLELAMKAIRIRFE